MWKVLRGACCAVSNRCVASVIVPLLLWSDLSADDRLRILYLCTTQVRQSQPPPAKCRRSCNSHFQLDRLCRAESTGKTAARASPVASATESLNAYAANPKLYTLSLVQSLARGHQRNDLISLRYVYVIVLNAHVLAVLTRCKRLHIAPSALQFPFSCSQVVDKYVYS